MPLLAIVAILVAAPTAGVAAALFGERRLQRELPAALSEAIETLGVRVELLELDGRPLWRHLTAGHLPGAHVRVADVPIRPDASAHLARLHVDLTNLTFTPIKAFRDEGQLPPGFTLQAATVTFRAHVRASDLFRVSGLAPVVTAFSFHDQQLRIQLPGGAWVDASLRLRPGRDHGDEIIVRPAQSLLRRLPLSSLAIPIPELPAGARVHRIAIEEGLLVADGTADGNRLLEHVDID